MKTFLTIGLLVLSNTFMTLAWYGHLKFAEWKWFTKLGLIGIILVSWGIALFEYCFQVPANRIGSSAHGGPFSIWELKAIQEVITLIESRYRICVSDSSGVFHFQEVILICGFLLAGVRFVIVSDLLTPVLCCVINGVFTHSEVYETQHCDSFNSCIFLFNHCMRQRKT
jgi:uncharacterized protein